MPNVCAPVSSRPGRLLLSASGVRAIARCLYDAVRKLIVSPHGHVGPQSLLDNELFCDPASRFVTRDHYVTRLLHSKRVTLDEPGVVHGPLVKVPTYHWLEKEAAEAIRHFLAALFETAGFSRTSTCSDETHAFCSLPARFDMFLRTYSGVLAHSVAEHRLEEGEALETAVDLVSGRPSMVFKL